MNLNFKQGSGSSQLEIATSILKLRKSIVENTAHIQDTGFENG
jgi:hypothetical protein